MLKMGDKNKKKNRKNRENKKDVETETNTGTVNKATQINMDNEQSDKKIAFHHEKPWTSFSKQKPPKNEFDAFAKYYEGIKEDNSVMEIAQAADILALSSYCDLYEGVKTMGKNDLQLNICQKPIRKRNENILYASHLVKLQENEEKGRHLIAHCHLDKNEILINEKATVLQVNPVCTCVSEEGSLYRCHDCASVCSIFYTCNNCNIVVFCTLDCLKRAYKLYHKYECEGLQRHYWPLDDTDYSYIAMRMMFYGAMNNFNTNVENLSCYGSETNNYPFIYRLQTNFDKLPLKKIHQILEISSKTLVYLICRTNFFNQFEFKNEKIRSDMYVYVGGLLVRHYCQAQTNNILVKFPNLVAGYGFNVVSGKGKAICPTIALLNHSCTPNAVIIPYNNQFVVKSIRAIKENEEITVCYNEVNALLTVDDRETITEELFFFTCKCPFCEFERTWEEHPYKCTMCANGKAKKVTLKTEDLGFCIVCQQYFHICLESEKLAKICQEVYRATYDLEHVLRIAEYYNNLYPRNSWMLLDVYKLLYDKYSVWGEKPIEVIKYGLLTFNILEHYIPRLYLPLLEAKIKFFFSVMNNERFLELERVTGAEHDTIKIFIAETAKTKRDLLFYLPVQYADFYYMELLRKLDTIQFNILVINNEEQTQKCL